MASFEPTLKYDVYAYLLIYIGSIHLNADGQDHLINGAPKVSYSYLKAQPVLNWTHIQSQRFFFNAPFIFIIIFWIFGT